MLKLKTKITASIATVLVFSAAQVMAQAPATEFTIPSTDFTIEDFWIDQSGPMVDVVTPFEFQKGTLRIMKQGGDNVWTQNLEGGLHVGVDLGAVVADGLTSGRYTYEVRFILNETMDTNAVDQEIGQEPVFKEFVTSGFFNVANGEVGDLQYNSQPGIGDLPTMSMQSTDKSGTFSDKPDGPKADLTTPDNLLVGGGGLFGPNDGLGALAGKVRIIEAGDGDGAGIAFVSNEETDGSGVDTSWLLGNNQGSFGLQRTISSVKTTIFGVEYAAPENSLRIAGNGSIGMGTATPSNRLHVVGSGDAGLVLENPAALSGVSVVTDSGGNMRFRSPVNSTRMVINNVGQVGIGTGTTIVDADAKLHVRGSNGTGKMLLEETSAIATNSMFTMRNNGNPGFQLENTDQGTDWQFRLGGSGATEQFTINKTSVAGPELSVLANGNVRIKGSYLTGSSRAIKQDIVAIAAEEILKKVSQLPVYEWSYKASPGARHVGPMAEDYHEVFGLAGGGKGLAATDVSGIALASIQAINAKAERLENENQVLKMRLDALEAALLQQ